MTFFKRAFTSIKRNFGKTLLLFLIALILSSVISGAISSNQATENMERNLIDSMLPLAMVQADWELFDELAENRDEWWRAALTPELIREVGGLPFVASYDFFTSYSLNSMLQPYEPEGMDDIFGDMMMRPQPDQYGEIFVFRGVQNPNITDIEQNIIELVDGRVFTSEEVNQITHANVAIISRELADLNQLVVGSTITFRNLIFDFGGDFFFEDEMPEVSVFAEESYDLVVVGIYNPISLPDYGDEMSNHWMTRDLQNRIYVPNLMVELASQFSENAMREMDPENFESSEEGFSIWRDNFFVLRSPAYISDFREATLEIVPPYFQVVDTGNSFRPILSALETMRDLTLTVLFVAIGSALLILTLLITLFLRDRKREVGIYLALGEKKRRIVAQFLLEIMTVSFLAIVVALFIGNILATNLAENMLMNDIITQQEIADNARQDWDPFAHMGFETDVSAEVIAQSYDVSLNMFAILLFFAIGLGTTLLATVIPMIYVLRLNPKKIML